MYILWGLGALNSFDDIGKNRNFTEKNGYMLNDNIISAIITWLLINMYIILNYKYIIKSIMKYS